jgi:predicted Zn-dependent peptidase
MLTPSELADRVQAVTSEDVQAVARDVMRNDRLAMAIVGNIKNPENLKNLLHF